MAASNQYFDQIRSADFERDIEVLSEILRLESPNVEIPLSIKRLFVLGIYAKLGVDIAGTLSEKEIGSLQDNIDGIPNKIDDKKAG
ncbi:hypothetical protein [Maricaulis virginensis]|uniref:Uncharacterized protein n=1 Tax=Maricaulis virginensis TaxID=144022 RepID=A0A9W6IQQ7_9PROT|nr:hypothetical protein [Maricaulis virginensis]GLK53615.1 hypothetical protein GCM10017621_31230 [Maricaulis virginensis]